MEKIKIKEYSLVRIINDKVLHKSFDEGLICEMMCALYKDAGGLTITTEEVDWEVEEVVAEKK